MAKLKVKALFEDSQEHIDRKPGDVFECSDERARHILAVLGDDFVEIVEEKAAEKPAAKRTTRAKAKKSVEE